MTPSKASAKASIQQSATAADAAREELAFVWREAAAAKEASAAEVSLMRRQLASAQSAAADAEGALADAEKVMPQHDCFSLREDRKSSFHHMVCWQQLPTCPPTAAAPRLSNLEHSLTAQHSLL